MIGGNDEKEGGMASVHEQSILTTRHLTGLPRPTPSRCCCLHDGNLTAVLAAIFP